MSLRRFKLKLWMLEMLIWALGLLSAVVAGADSNLVSLSEKDETRGIQPLSHSVGQPSDHKLSSLAQGAAGFHDASPSQTESDLKLSQISQVPPGGAARARVQAAYGRLPLGFEINRGQSEPTVDFLSQGTNYLFFLKANEAELRFPKGPSGSAQEAIVPSLRKTGFSSQRFTTLRMRLAGGSISSKPHGLEEMSRKSHYLRGNDPQRWQIDVPNYAKVQYPQVYQGIDLIYYGSQQQLEYDFVVAPGGDPKCIRLQFEGLIATREKPALSLDQNGDLLLQTEAGEVRQKRAVAFQERDGTRDFIQSNYVIQGENTITFALGSYDSSQALVIDPVITYSLTGIGGSAIAVDAEGNSYVAGTAGPGFTTTPGAAQPAPGGGNCVSGPNTIPCPDILVAKLNPSGTELLYSTFLGGSGSDYAYGIALDLAGNAYVTGSTSSTNFPTTPDAFRTTHDRGTCGSISATALCNNAFVAKLNSHGTAFVYSTYLNGSGGGLGGNGIAVDAQGQAYVTGDQASGSFVAKLTATGSAVVYSASGIGGSAIAVDSVGNAFVTGRKGPDSFVSKLAADGSSVVYSFRLGGTFTVFSAPPEEVEALTSIAVDLTGNAYVTGYTAYKDFPTTPGVPFPTPAGVGICGNSLCRDAFIAKLNNSGTGLVYSTFLGGDSIDYGTGINVDASGNAYVTGVTRSTNFPTSAVAQPSSGGGVFVAKLNATGSALSFSTTLGSGHSSESGNGIAVDTFGNAYITGNAGPSFPVSAGSFQPAAGTNAGFVAKIFDDLTLFVPIILSSAGQNNSFFMSELTLTNRAARDAVVEFTYTAAFGGGSGKATDSLAAGRQRVVPDAITYLRSLGVPIPDSGNRGGTLAVRFSGLSSPTEGAVTVRTATAVTQGRVGLAYRGIHRGLAGPCYLFGLRHDAIDRSNVAIQNAGSATEGDITLRITVYSGEPSFPSVSLTLPDETLAPGQFRQLSGILQSSGLGLNNGFVRVERVSGTAPYYTYAVVNDQTSSDGSFIVPILPYAKTAMAGSTLSVVVESSSFNSDLVLANGSPASKVVQLAFVADGIQAPGSTASLSLLVRSQEQLIVPNIVRWMREHGAKGLESQDRAYVGALFVTVPDGDVNGLYVGARTVSRGGGGQYGVSYDAVPYGAASSTSAWIYGLQQNDENRSNLGLVNTGEADENPNMFRIELFDGETGLKVNTLDNVTVNTRRLLQIGSVFEKYAPGTKQGYLHIVRTSGSNPFIAYSVINDGATPGDRTGDGAFISSSP